jgi:hypothetical protein
VLLQARRLHCLLLRRSRFCMAQRLLATPQKLCEGGLSAYRWAHPVLWHLLCQLALLRRFLLSSWPSQPVLACSAPSARILLVPELTEFVSISDKFFSVCHKFKLSAAPRELESKNKMSEEIPDRRVFVVKFLRVKAFLYSPSVALSVRLQLYRGSCRK